jgi:hypothetical protein
MLELQFSNYLVLPKHLEYPYRQKFVAQLSSLKNASATTSLRIRLIETNSSLFYVPDDHLPLLRLADRQFIDSFNVLRIGRGDVLRVNAGEFDEVQYFQQNFPISFFAERAVYNITTNGTSNLYVVHMASMRKMSSARTLKILGLDSATIHQVDENSHILSWTRGIDMGDPLPDAYDRGEELLIRMHKERQVFLVSNGTRRPLNSMQELARTPHLDLEKTVSLRNYFDVSIFPLSQ